MVLFPNPFKDMAKIVGNMMASNTYTKNKAINEIFPKLQTIRKVAITVPKAQHSRTLSARIRCMIQLPAKRPHINSPSPPNESEVSSPEYHCIYTSVYPVYQIPVKVLVLICGGAAFFFLYRRHKKNHISQKDVP